MDEEEDFITDYFKWIKPEDQKKKAEELTKMTRKQGEKDDI